MHSTSASTVKLVYKVKNDEAVIRLSFDAPVTLDAIKAAAVRQWPEAAGAELKYCDVDGDNVLLVAEGIGEALRCHAGPVLKVYIVHKNPAGT